MMFITHTYQKKCGSVLFCHTYNQVLGYLYMQSTQRSNIGIKPKEVLVEALNKFLKEKLKEKGFVFSDSQLKLTKKLKDGHIGVIRFRVISYS